MGGHAGPQRLRQLVDAVVALGTDLDLHAVLSRIVQVATDLVDARYGALGVVDEDRTRLVDFITVGIDDEGRAAIGDLPKGLGILGHLITDASPLRIADIEEHEGRGGFPPGHPPMRSFLGVPILVRGEVFGNLYLTEKTTAEVFTDIDEELVVGLATAAGVAIENARLYDRARRREATIAALSEIATSLLAEAPGEEVLQLIARRARELADADVATIVLAEPGGELRNAIADGMDADRLHGQVFTRAGSVTGEVLETGRPIVVDDTAADDRAAQPLIHLGAFGPALFVPLVDATPFGTLAVARRAGAPPFGPADVELLQSFADQTSVVLDHEKRRRQLSKLALLEDQERIARDLHDSVIQRIFAASLTLHGAAGLVTDERARERVERAVDELDAATRLIRSVIFRMGERTSLAESGLRRQVLELTTEATRVLGFPPGVVFDGPIDTVVPAPVAAELVPTLREALSNVARHAAAGAVDVEVTATPSGVTLRVRDDGAGLRGGSGGRGLRNMQERAARLGGTCLVEPGAEGRGTVVEWSVPLAGTP